MINKILNFIFPEKCSGCGEYGKNLCKNCLEKILERDKKIFKIGKTENNFLIYSPFFYHKNPILKKILKEIKYKNKFSKFSGLEEKIFQEFTKFLNSKNLLDQNIFLIPVPLHRKKQLKRGFNQSEIFCKKLEEKGLEKKGKNILNIKKLKLIKKIKNTKPQAESTKTERIKNLIGAFEINKKNIKKLNSKKYKNKKNIFILVDDVLSTGETMKNCKLELEKKFLNSEIYGFTICSDF